MDDIFNSIMHRALEDNATDIHIILKRECHISFRTLGELILYKTCSIEEGNKLINYIRFKAKIDMNYRLKPQTGHYTYLLNKQILYLRVSSLPSQDMDSIVVRILNHYKSLSLNQLTPFPPVIKFLHSIIKKQSGLFVISGATGSGKSTTLYTLLDTIHDTCNRNIVTLEDPIEVKKEYGLQIQINESMGITYESSLRQILRHDPDVIMIGEIRDQETAKLAITCALTGHLVFTTIHAGNCLMTIRRLMNLEVLQVDLEDILIGVMTQKMLYKKESKKPIVLLEYMEKAEIKKYLYNGFEQYTTFANMANYLVKNSYISQKQIEDYLDE